MITRRQSDHLTFWWEAMAFEEMLSIISGDPQRMVHFLSANSGGKFL